MKPSRPVPNRRAIGVVSIAATVVAMSACGARPESASSVPAPWRMAPRVDHHQHIMSDASRSQPPAAAPLIELPAELAAVLEARNRMFITGQPGDVFRADAMVRDPFEGVWLRGEEAIAFATSYSSDSRFLANGYTLGTSSATITGPIRDGDLSRDWLHYAMGLERDASGAWRITSETQATLPSRLFAEEIRAEHVIANLDDTGIERAVLLSVAYWHGEGEVEAPGEIPKVRAENDWTVAQAALYPDRLVAFCGIPPLRDYSLDEIRRCARELGVRGIKMHFRAADVNVHDPDHLAKVRRIFEVANEEGMAIILHAETQAEFGAYDRDEAEIILNQLIAAAPDVVVQIAHMWGGNEYSPEALAVYANAVSSGDARARKLYFDLTEIVRGAFHDPERLASIAQYARQIGMDRLLYGSDASGSPELPPSTLGWGLIRRELGLTDAELADIADNVAPYLHEGAR